jgi:hypothetical protein
MLLGIGDLLPAIVCSCCLHIFVCIVVVYCFRRKRFALVCIATLLFCAPQVHMRWTVVVVHVLQLQVQLLLILLLCALIALLVVGSLKAAPTSLLEQQILAVFTAAGEDVALKQTQIQSLLKDSFGTVLGAHGRGAHDLFSFEAVHSNCLQSRVFSCWCMGCVLSGSTSYTAGDVPAAIRTCLPAGTQLAQEWGQCEQAMACAEWEPQGVHEIYGWFGQQSGSGFCDQTPATLRVFASLDRF